MQQPKRVLVIMNLAGIGRASMAAALPVLNACGVQACPLPTAVLSSHLGGFGEVAGQPLAQYGLEALQRIKNTGTFFDAVYTGYLPSIEDFAVAKAAFTHWPDALKVVDPALGDNGRLYSKTTEPMVTAMCALAEKASLITPNLTESALLLGKAPATVPSVGELDGWLASLAQNGRRAVITSAPAPEGNVALAGQEGARRFFVTKTAVPQNYPGTGDLFAAALTGLTLAGHSLQAATRRAASFVAAAAKATYDAKGEVRQGVWFEPQLHRLAPAP